MRRLRALLSRTDERPITTGAGFSSLAEELIQDILQYLRWPTDFYILSLVSRVLHRHATPELYATLVIAYHRPARISALLALMENNPQRANYVRTLLFDEDVKSIGPNLQPQGRWPDNAYRRELTDGWDPASPDVQSIKSYPHTTIHVEIARRLRVVLPSLRNLQSVVMRSLHPAYMYPGALGDVISPGASFIADALPLGMEISSLCPENGVWRYIFDGSSQITEIFVNGVPSGRLNNVAFSSLTTIGISDLFYSVDGHEDAARLWNTVLTRSSNLKTLVMVHVEQAPLILHGLVFPKLEALELYMVYLGAPHETDSTVFINFLYRHSNTLRILALSCPMWGTIDHSRWLSDKLILSKLHTLRLNHTMALLVTVDELTSLPGSAVTGGFDTLRTQKTDILFEFIRNRPSILDVGISSLKRPEADEFARSLTDTRPMRNVFIGEREEQSLLSRTCRTHRFWGYGYDAWAFYELFGGLKITKSGFRPRLPPQPWKFWKKTTLQ